MIDLVLTQEGGICKGTVPKLIVDFNYTITGHAYRPYDNGSDNWTKGVLELNRNFYSMDMDKTNLVAYV